MRRAVVDPRFAARLRELRAERGLSLRLLEQRAFFSKSYLHELETGKRSPTVELARRLDDALDARGNSPRW